MQVIKNPVVFETFEIQDINIADISRLIEIEKNLFVDPWPSEIFMFLISGNDLAKGVYSNGELIAYIFALWEYDTCHIANIAVHAHYQRNGFGRMLLTDIIQRACYKGMKNVTLEVRASNFAAIGFYLNSGFERYGVYKNYYNDGETALILRKEL